MKKGNLYICYEEVIVMYLKDNPFDSNLFYGIVIKPLDEGFEKGYFCREWNKNSFNNYEEELTIKN